ncbi:unnamed protein product [Phyllotreta striolata]|uniref:C2H2-type domain-containing protein n=1 Tax=Phyllotreta striolata TaxID=444603 RepID=A0A9N9TLC7_PHYSR|nr:unnamed protein product [Phyllotreta striolata]
MDEHSLNTYRDEPDLVDEDFLRPELVYEQDTNDPTDSDEPNLTRLGPLIEYVYDPNQIQIPNEPDKTDIDVNFEENISPSENKDLIQPMMPFFLSSSPVFTIINEDNEIRVFPNSPSISCTNSPNFQETIILQIENEAEEQAFVPKKKPPQKPKEPIPDEIRASTLQSLLCTGRTDTFACEICTNSYGCLNCLKSHYETMHVGNTLISQYKCKYSTHVSKGLYCPVCELIFDTRNDTMDHYITHAVACDICGSGFDRQFYLSEHMKTAHNKSVPDVLYDCEICKMTYKCSGGLSKHYQNFHKIILCVECNEKFESTGDLVEHEKTHRQKIDVLPFACSKCDKAFAQISDIAVHIRQDHNHKRKSEQINTIYLFEDRKAFKKMRKKARE